MTRLETKRPHAPMPTNPGSRHACEARRTGVKELQNCCTVALRGRGWVRLPYAFALISWTFPTPSPAGRAQVTLQTRETYHHLPRVTVGHRATVPRELQEQRTRRRPTN